MKKKETRIVHSGRENLGDPAIVNAPIYRASTVLFDSLAQMEDIQAAWLRDEPVATYGVTNMPNALALENAVAELEGGYRALSFPSGHAAIAAALLACAKAGDHILVSDSCYGPTRRTCTRLLARLGIETEFYDPHIGGEIDGLMRDNTRVVFAESPGSHTFEVQDLPAIVRVARARGAKVVFDNTWATGWYFRAFEHGADLVVQAASKYIAGHSDVLAGLVVANDEMWPALRDCSRDLGQHVSPEDCFLALRGLRTLGVRLPRHQESALALASWMQRRPEVKRVLYPALPGDPGYALWKRDFLGASGLFAIELQPKSSQAIAAMLDHYELFGLGYSWGGFESLVVPANIDQARSVKPWTGGPLIRYHAGLENVEDLIADLDAGFARLNASR
jgi:cystathionine beta-lyase